MKKRLLLWVGAYGALCALKAWLGYPPLAYKGVMFEAMAMGGLMAIAAAFSKKSPYFAPVWSLGMSRALTLLTYFLSSPLGGKVLHALNTPRLDLAQWQKFAIPMLLGVAVMEVMNLKFGQGGTAYSGKKFIKDANNATLREPAEFILGKTGLKRVAAGASERGKHLQIVGPTGSGKTQLILGMAYQDMLRKMPVFVMEAKGDKSDFELFLKLAEKAGRLQDVVYFNPASAQSMSFNPIRPVGPDWDPVVIADQLIRAIGREPGSDTDGDHYRNMDLSRLVDLAEILVKVGAEFTLEDVYSYFNSEESRAHLFDRCSDQDKGLVENAHKGLKRADLSGITAQLRPWVSGNLGRLLNQSRPQITLESVFEQNKLAYFSIPVGYMPLQTNALGRMIIASVLAYAQMRQNSKLRRPASLYLDEFPEFLTPSFSTLISTMRSAELWACLSHQDLGQLKRIEGMDKEAFVSNVFANTAGGKVFFKMTSADDAEKVAALMGTHRVKARTRQIKTGMFFDMGTGMATEGERETFNVHPNELKRLPAFKAVALVGNSGPKTIATPQLFKGLEGPVSWSPNLEITAPNTRPPLDLKVEPREFSNDGTLRQPKSDWT